MKIIHTSDWHLGHLLYNYSREAEQQSMLAQLAEHVRREQPDVLLLAGDVYDTTQPSTAVQRMLAEALISIHAACPTMTIISIAGNHDSASRHDIFRTPWSALGVHTVGYIGRDSEPDDYIFGIEGRGYVVAVPFAADRLMPDDIYQRLAERVSERNAEGLPVVLTAHLAVTGSDYRGHEQSDEGHIGGLSCQSCDVFGPGYDYVALGHIHRGQQLDAEGRIRYCGTPLAISFDEVYGGNTHGALLVEVTAHGDVPRVTPLPITTPLPLVTLPTDGGFAPWDEVRAQLSDFPDDLPAYIRLNVEVEGYLPASAQHDAAMICDTKACRLCLINTRRRLLTATGEQQMRTFTTTELQELAPAEVARMYFEDRDLAFDDEMAALLDEALRSLDEQND